MNNKFILAGLTSIILLLLFTGCTEPIEINTDDSAPVIVIYSELTDQFKRQEVKITRSSPYFDDTPNAGISGAKVTITSSSNTVYSFLEHDTIPGLYYSLQRFSAEKEMHYSLKVEVDFDNDGIPEEYEANTTIASVVTPDSLTLEPLELFGHQNYWLYLHCQDPPEENYYLFRVMYNDSLVTNKISNYLISDDALLNGQYFKGNIYRFNDISNKENDSEERRERSIYLQPGDRITTTTSLIPKGFYEFISQCQGEKNGENPMFGGPASNITTNISNGGVGYFAGYCTAETNILYDPDKLKIKK
jgi:hypothetical protein